MGRYLPLALSTLVHTTLISPSAAFGRWSPTTVPSRHIMSLMDSLKPADGIEGNKNKKPSPPPRLGVMPRRSAEVSSFAPTNKPRTALDEKSKNGEFTRKDAAWRGTISRSK